MAIAQSPARTVTPDLSRYEAMLALCKSGLTIVSETPGAWENLPAAARERFGDAFFSMNGAERRIHDIAQERDDERAGLNKAIDGLRERDAVIKALQYRLGTDAPVRRALRQVVDALDAVIPVARARAHRKSERHPESEAVRAAIGASDVARAALAEAEGR